MIKSFEHSLIAKVLEWLFPAMAVIAATLTAYDVYPLNKWFFVFGNGGLAGMCLVWKRYSLAVLNSYIAVINLTGLIFV